MIDNDAVVIFAGEVFYHVTHRSNFSNIQRRGLLPSMSRGLVERVYAVEHERVSWALNHVSNRDEVPVSGLIILVVMRGDHWRRFRNGIWYTTDKIEPVTSVPLGAFIEADLDEIPF